MKKRKIASSILIIVLIIVISKNIVYFENHNPSKLTQTNSINSNIPLNQPIDASNVKIRDGIKEFSPKTMHYQTPHSPILIVGNTDFHTQALNNWDLGGTRDGTQDKPYIISGYRITGSSTEKLIEISGTDVHFQIENCILENGLCGILFSSVANGIIYENTIANNSVAGIKIDTSNTTRIEANLIYNNSEYGILFDKALWENNAVGNRIYNQNYGIYSWESVNNTWNRNEIFNTTKSGFYLYKSKSNELNNNTLYSNYFGVELFIDCLYNEVINNYVHDNTGVGLGIYDGSNSSTVTGNTISENEQYGIEITSSSSNSIISNRVYNNSIHGIQLANSSLNELFYNIISDNHMKGIQLGVHNDQGSNHNIISCNNITHNELVGLYLDRTSEYNEVYKNNFVQNTIPARSQAYDYEENNNVFDQNYWDDWAGTGVYEIEGYIGITNEDSNPLATPVNINDCCPYTDWRCIGSFWDVINTFAIIVITSSIILISIKKKKNRLSDL